MILNFLYLIYLELSMSKHLKCEHAHAYTHTNVCIYVYFYDVLVLECRPSHYLTYVWVKNLRTKPKISGTDINEYLD